MRAAAIFGPASSERNLRPFDVNGITWLDAASEDADAVLVFGGDGTIHRHLNDLVRFQRPVLVVPSGSGNDFAHSLGLRSPRDAQRAWQAFCATQANVRVIDLGLIRSVANEAMQPRYFSCVAGIGLDADICRRANAMPRWLRGHGGYALGLPLSLFNFAPVETTIRAQQNGEWKEHPPQPVMLAAFANTPRYGGGMRIAPRALIDDGLLDACVIRSINPFRLFCLFPTVYFGRHLQIKEVDYFQTKAVRLETASPVDLYADGEFVCRTPAEISIAPGALRVIVPRVPSYQT